MDRLLPVIKKRAQKHAKTATDETNRVMSRVYGAKERDRFFCAPSTAPRFARYAITPCAAISPIFAPDARPAASSRKYLVSRAILANRFALTAAKNSADALNAGNKNPSKQGDYVALAAVANSAKRKKPPTRPPRNPLSSPRLDSFFKN